MEPEKKHEEVRQAEAKEISKESIEAKTRIKIGSELAAFGQSFGGIDLDITKVRESSQFSLPIAKK